MSTHKHIDKICCAVLAFTVILSALFICSEAFGVEVKARTMGYEDRIFDTSKVHTVDIVMDDWEGFIETCTNEEYATCSVVIDGEAYKNVAIRAKGNTSLSRVESSESDRYSFKIEFDHYDGTNTYHGLDKLCLNNIIQDNTYMKDYLTYQMMNEFGVAAPLCSYANITVNGEEWGLYLAVEAVEESFLTRNYGSDYGELYKPDSLSMGGGRGNGMNFDMEDWEGFEDIFGSFSEESMPDNESSTFPDLGSGSFPNTESGTFPDMSGGFSDRFGSGMSDMFGGFGSDDVSLIYSDDDYSSYSNIFDSAKTDVSDADKDRLIAALKSMNEQSDIESSVYVEDVIRYFVVHNFVVNFDSYTGSMIHNYYLYENDGKLAMIPWDYNLAFGGFMSSSDAESIVNYPIDSPVSGGSVESRPMLSWIFADEEYTETYHSLFSDFIAEFFESGRFSEMIESVKEMISPYVESDPSKFCTYEEFLTGIDTLRDFCLLRAESVRGQLDGVIGSTSEAQSDKANFVNADGISISDMGSMGVGMGGGMDFSGDFTKPERTESQTTPSDSGNGEIILSPPTESEAPDASAETPSQGQTPPDMNGEMPQEGSMQFPGNENGDMPQGGDMELPSDMQMPDDMSNGGNKNPFGGDNAGNAQTGQSDSGNLILLISSVAVLGAGLIFAIKFKR